MQDGPKRLWIGPRLILRPLLPTGHTAENNKELIDIFDHKIYVIYINLWLTYRCLSNLITQFNAVKNINLWTKVSVLFSGFRPPKLSLSITINELLRFGLIDVDNDSLEDTV